MGGMMVDIMWCGMVPRARHACTLQVRAMQAAEPCTCGHVSGHGHASCGAASRQAQARAVCTPQA
eukprot:351307-Chlamydomonas_euryale.AAC.2